MSTAGKAPPPPPPTATDPPAAGQRGQGDDSGAAAVRISLSDALTRLVDAAVAMVEANNMDGAVSLMREGITTFEPQFPNR